MTGLVSVLVAFAFMILVAPVNDARTSEPVIIGDARMLEDGTIVITMRRTAGGIHVSGVVRYPVSDPSYAEVLNHVGGMKPGGTRLVPAWDDAVPHPKQ